MESVLLSDYSSFQLGPTVEAVRLRVPSIISNKFIDCAEHVTNPSIDATKTFLSMFSTRRSGSGPFAKINIEPILIPQTKSVTQCCGD